MPIAATSHAVATTSETALRPTAIATRVLTRIASLFVDFSKAVRVAREVEALEQLNDDALARHGLNRRTLARDIYLRHFGDD